MQHDDGPPHAAASGLLPSDDGEHDVGYHKTLRLPQLLSIGVGSIIGAGIFVLTGQAAAQYAGPAVAISFIISGVACTFSGLCYAELAAMIPCSGSAYTYAKLTLGRGVSWVIGWDLVLEYLVAASTVAVGWSGYFVSLLADVGVVLPPAITNAPIDYDIDNNVVTTPPPCQK
jgi:basic amino acid/polyamine antiporter, APA family